MKKNNDGIKGLKERILGGWKLTGVHWHLRKRMRIILPRSNSYATWCYYRPFNYLQEILYLYKFSFRGLDKSSYNVLVPHPGLLVPLQHHPHLLLGHIPGQAAHTQLYARLGHSEILQFVTLPATTSYTWPSPANYWVSKNCVRLVEEVRE